MKIVSILGLLFIYLNSNAQVVLNADGPGNTYALITSVLAPGHNPIEVPDCSHSDFDDHIDEIFDNELNANVFRFFMHVTPDDDRCINFDRQRNEIKSYDKSPDNLLGVENEKVVYKWKFKLADGFQPSPNFTHLHQLKSVGGSLANMPMYTLTARKGNPDRLELRYAQTDSQVTLIQTELAPLIDTWLEVTETIVYGTSGTYDIEIKRVSDGTILFAYSNNDIINWRPNADFVRPKWGIYRSLINAQDLRDEAVLFANFSIEEVATLSLEDIKATKKFVVYPNPVINTVQLSEVPQNANLIQIYSLDGRIIKEKIIDVNSQVILDISSFVAGAYLIKLSGKQLSQSQLIIKSN